MESATINNGKIEIYRPTALEAYVVSCINDAVERIGDNVHSGDNPLRYVVEGIMDLNQAYDPEWQPYARYAKDNLADTETALDFIKKYYSDIQDVVNYMVDNQGRDFYEYLFKDKFDLVKLTVCIYGEVTDQIARKAGVLEEDD